MKKEHYYHTKLRWTGNTGNGTSSYGKYSRDFEISVVGKPLLEGSSDPAFRGSSERYNPEEMLLASLSSCHMLWYLHLCAEAGVVVINYDDKAIGTMVETRNGSGRFSSVVLNPVVWVADKDMVLKGIELHQKAHEMCFIANSVNFPVTHFPSVSFQL